MTLIKICVHLIRCMSGHIYLQILHFNLNGPFLSGSRCCQSHVCSRFASQTLCHLLVRGFSPSTLVSLSHEKTNI